LLIYVFIQIQNTINVLFQQAMSKLKEYKTLSLGIDKAASRPNLEM